MEDLSSGIVLKLYEEMGMEEKEVHCDCKKEVLLQIGSIIPVLGLGEDDLWPNRGFFLKVLDSTHYMFVSLPQREAEMVLRDKLQLGQLIYVRNLEPAHPVPVLKGVRPIPGRRFFPGGDPQELVGVDILDKFCGKSDVFDKCYSASRFRVGERRDDRMSKPSPDRLSGLFDAKGKSGKEISRKRSSVMDRDSYTESSFSVSSSGSNPRRKSWGGALGMRSGGLSDVAVVKHQMKPVHSSPIANMSPVRLGKARNDIPVRCCNRSRDHLSVTTNKDHAGALDLCNGKISTESQIFWDLCPPTLVKLGKEVCKQRDQSLLVAVEALQEAAASERFLRCLSTFSELQLKEDDRKSLIDKFFQLQDYMAESCEIIHSLTNISPLRTVATDADLNSHVSIKEALKLAVERKKGATLWVKAAVASDLVSVSAIKTKTASPGATNSAQTQKNVRKATKPTGTKIAKSERNTSDMRAGLLEKENQTDLLKGTALGTTTNFARSLQDECRSWFLMHIEKYLDDFNVGSMFKESNSQVAVRLCRMKRLNDWLDSVLKKEGHNERFVQNSSEFEVLERLKQKVYAAILKHIERTAFVLENMDSVAQGYH